MFGDGVQPLDSYGVVVPVTFAKPQQRAFVEAIPNICADGQGPSALPLTTQVKTKPVTIVPIIYQTPPNIFKLEIQPRSSLSK